MAPKNRAEYRKTVADAFINVLSEKGLDWRKTWDMNSTAPQNAVTGSHYHGVNQFYLGLIAMERGYSDPRWATMMQIMDKNGLYHKGQKWHLQAGSKAVFVEYWYPYDKLERKQLSWKEFRALSPTERADDRYMLRVRYTPVFHASMIDGIPPLEMPRREPQELSDIVARLSKSMGVEILNDGGSRAFYRPKEDKIHLPLSTAFHGEYEYNATALHELAHSTGHPTRLNRQLSGHFGSEEYAFEELIAEISSCFMSVDLDVEQMPQHLENHKAYVQNWISVLKEKPEALAQAISQAQRAATYMDFHAGLITEQQYNATLGSVMEPPKEEKTEAAPTPTAATENNPVTELPDLQEGEAREGTRAEDTQATAEVYGAYAVQPAPKTWPLETEFGKVNDFRDYIMTVERSFGVDIRLHMPDETNKYVTELISEGKILPADAAHTAMYVTQVEGEWVQALSVNYMSGPYREAHLTTPDAAGMQKLLEERFPGKDFTLRKDVDSKHVLLTEQMKTLGYEPTTVDGFSDDFLMWKETATGREFGVDGWEGVQAFIETQNETTSASAQAEDANEDTFSIYQLRRDLDPDLRRDLSFSSLDEVKRLARTVELANYDCVYTGGFLRPEDTLDTIYEEFNLRRPDDFVGHSPSVSDLIVTVRDGVTQAFYVDSVGFEELPEISQEIAELDSYVGAKIERDGNMYEAIGTNGNKLILQSTTDDYHTEVTLAELKLQESELTGQKLVTVQTNIGEIPIEDYRDIVARQNGFDDYADMRKSGLALGNGYDDPAMPAAKTEPQYELVELYGKETLLTYSRVDRESVPEGWFKYEIRGVEGNPTLRRLEHHVLSNYEGTILSPERIDIPEDSGFRNIIHSDIRYSDQEMTLSEFQERVSALNGASNKSMTMSENERTADELLKDWQNQPWQPPEDDAELDM